MHKYKYTISQALDLVGQNFVNMDPETIAHLRTILKSQAKLITKELRHNGENVNPDILAARLNEYIIQMKGDVNNKDPDLSANDFPIFNVSHNSVVDYPTPINSLHGKRKLSSIIQKTATSYSTNTQQPSVNWYYIKPSATYYKSVDKRSTPASHHSHSRPSSELNHLTYSNSQKILVNVINDNTTRIHSRKSSLKSNKKEKISKKKIYTSPNTVIGSQTVEELYRVVNNQNSTPSRTTSIAERVIIIDRPDNNKTVHEKDRLRIFEIGTSVPATPVPSPGYITQQPAYYNTQQVVYQQPEMYSSLPSNIYSTSYAANPNTFYPYVYYQY